MKVEVSWLGAPPEQVVPLVGSCVSLKYRLGKVGGPKGQRCVKESTGE